MAIAERGDTGIARSRVQRAQTGRLGELPRERMLAPARPDQEHLHRGRVYCSAFAVGARACTVPWTTCQEPGIDLHEWETRWAELEEEFADDPAGALPEACDLIEETLGVDDEPNDDLEQAYRAAREVADAVERGDDVDPGDVGAAIENLQLIRNAIRAGDEE